MANSSTNTGSSLDAVSVISSPFLLWMENKVLPILAGIFLLCVTIVGTVLNSLILKVVYGQQKHSKIQMIHIRAFLTQVVITDFAAYVVIVLPAIVAAFAGSWELSKPVCLLFGIIGKCLFIASFFLMMIMCLEGTLNVCRQNLHRKLLVKRNIILVSVAVWLVALGVGLIPLTGWGELEYLQYQYRCTQTKTNLVDLYLTHVFVVFLPSIILFFCTIAVYRKRRELLESLSSVSQKVDEINLKVAKRGNAKLDPNHCLPVLRQDTDVSRELHRSATPSHVTTDIDFEGIKVEESQDHGKLKRDSDLDIAGRGTGPNTAGETTTRSERTISGEICLNTPVTESEKIDNDKVAHGVYTTSTEQVEITLAISYFLMYYVAMVLWLPYIILTLIVAHNTLSVWNGWFSLLVVLSDATYFIKPVVFLGHNRSLKSATIQKVPESLRVRADRASRVLQKTINKLDKTIFNKGPEQMHLIDPGRGRVSPMGFHRKTLNEKEVIVV